MRAYSLRLLGAAVVLGVLGYAALRGGGAIPPLGPFLDPANGVWSLARSAELRGRGEVRVPGLGAPVRVLYDDRGVPHIFAATESDAWRAEGYVVARDRLFQMDLQSRAGAGTLSELVGARALEVDRADRRRGFRWAAERVMAGLDSTALISRAARAYADGVNAWIDQLDRSALPLEYRLLGSRPARWEPINTVYLFLQMAYTLAWDDHTLDKLRVQALVGAAAADALFPRNSPIQEPIQPNGEGAPRYDFVRPLPPPGAPDTAALVAARERVRADLALGWAPARPGDGDAIGSNNWVVGPRRTAAGFALLAGDPHLELSLPSVWYEVHLQVDGGPDVAGVTFPAAPGVIIGFNRDVAWSFTNTGADVRDYYRETVDDTLHPARYQVDGAWRQLTRRVETIRGPHGEVLADDTLLFTHRGPLAREGGRWLSMRWTPFEAKSLGGEFLQLDRAHSVGEWLDGWKDYVAAAQNGVVADRSGTIAIRSTGKYPVRPDDRGDRLEDGSRSSADWSGFLPLTDYPFARDPAQGYLASANQQPVDPRANPHYFGVDWYSPWRAMRINQLLRGDSSVTPDAMRGFQTDVQSARADAFVPLLVEAGRAAGDSAGQAAALLAAWDHRYARESRGAVLFDAVMAALSRLTWDELVPPRTSEDSAPAPQALPEEAVLLELAADSTSLWWDRRGTAAVERRDAILTAALREGLTRTVRDHGPADGPGWRWDQAHQANLYHLLRIPSLSALGLSVVGGPSTLTPSPGRGTHGPSWRMVVELGPAVRGWATYPGGQSGNPASSRYLNRLPLWLEGRLDTVRFPARPEELPAAVLRAELLLVPEPR